ncbi:MAG TPA: ABC transporter permease [Acidimicrobiales bacterium]|jgi:ABC-2 type transport system permease protein|nr:ABC transporter permease [Acidimicrobiales bacterium]
MNSYVAYAWLEAKRQWRSRDILIFRLGIPVAIYLVLRSTNAGDQDMTTASSGLAGLPSETARMLAVAALASVISGLAAGPALADERASGWLRQLRVTPLRPGAAVTAKIAVAMSFALPAIALVAAAAGITERVDLGAVQWVEVVGLMWLATTPITAIATLVGLAFATEVAQAAHTLTWVILWLLGGIFTPLSNMPDAVAAIGERLPSNAVINVGWATASGDPIPASAIAVLTAWTLGAGGLAALAWRRVISR